MTPPPPPPKPCPRLRKNDTNVTMIYLHLFKFLEKKKYTYNSICYHNQNKSLKFLPFNFFKRKIRANNINVIMTYL